ncbi:MAG: hypothetical protein WAX07_05565 [Candidatus Altiarchaeia archaeon]
MANGDICTESEGKNESLQQASSALAEGMKVYAVALGDDANDTFLRNLSDTGGGKFYNVSCTSTLEQIYRNISENEAFDNLMLVSDVSGSMSSGLSLDCTTTTTTTTSSSSTTSSTSSTTSTSTSTTTTTTSTTTTTQGPCIMPGNNPPCAEVSLEEVIAAINQWIAGNMELGSVIDLIMAWSGRSAPN